METKELEFRLDLFIKYLRVQKINISRPKLISRLKRILEAKKKHATITNDFKEESKITTWTIPNYTVPKDKLVIEGTAEEQKTITPDGN